MPPAFRPPCSRRKSHEPHPGRIRRLPERPQDLWRLHGHSRPVADCRARHAGDLARPLRLRQDHDAAHARRPRTSGAPAAS
ncbi:hypothetical protein LZK73_30755 (plasmid) [Neorhizobium galegae]|nr:hypothetical protein LZK73_30755 [Neorhizobium galegae]